MALSMRLATANDEITLKRLYLNCFDDTLGFVNMFFAHHFVPENTVVAEKDGRAVGLSFLLPCSVEGSPCYYVYGVCVAPEERGQGIGRELLSFTVELAKKRGARVLLKPENESLFAFYERVGFSPCSYYREEVISGGGEQAELYEVSEEEYGRLRNEGFAGKNAVLWDSGSVEYALAHEIFFGSRAYKFHFCGEEGIALFMRDGNKTVLKETTASEKALQAVVTAGLRLYGDEEITVLFPSDESGTPYAYGIGFDHPVYLNLMLD